jgi:hypothetical protein
LIDSRRAAYEREKTERARGQQAETAIHHDRSSHNIAASRESFDLSTVDFTTFRAHLRVANCTSAQ